MLQIAVPWRLLPIQNLNYFNNNYTFIFMQKMQPLIYLMLF